MVGGGTREKRAVPETGERPGGTQAADRLVDRRHTPAGHDIDLAAALAAAQLALETRAIAAQHRRIARRIAPKAVECGEHAGFETARRRADPGHTRRRDHRNRRPSDRYSHHRRDKGPRLKLPQPLSHPRQRLVSAGTWR